MQELGNVRAAFFAFLLASSLPLVGQSGWADLVGKPAPAVTPEVWMNTGKAPAPDDLSGKVLVLQFFATDGPESQRSVGQLSSLHDRFHGDGLRVVAISYEEEKQVRKAVEGKFKNATYPIACDTSYETTGRFRQEGSLLLPYYFVVDAKGIVIGNRLPTEEDIVALLLDSAKIDRDRLAPYPPLKALMKLVDDEYYGAAYAAAAEAARDEKAGKGLAETAAYVRGQLERKASLHQRALEDVAYKPERYGRAFVARFRYVGMPTAVWAEQQVAELGDHERIKDQERAWKYLERALDKEFGGDFDERTLQRAKREYERVVSKYEGSEAAKRAADRIRAIERQLRN